MSKFQQRGVSLSGLLVWAIILGLVGITGMRVVPSAIDYFTLLKDAKAAVAASGPNATVADVRKTFSKYADVDRIEFNPADLEITKDNGQIVISFSYEKKLPLFGRVSLLIDYSGTTAGSSGD